MSMRSQIRRLAGVVSLAALIPSSGRSGQPTLAAIEYGHGEPTIVLIHGLGQDRGLWNRIAPLLAGQHRLVLVDLPGHGGSQPIPNVSVRAVAQAVERTLKDRKVKRALLVGHSYGGLVALQEAAAHPERAAGVVSIDIPTYTVIDSERVANLDNLIRVRYLAFLERVFGPMTRDSSQVDSVIVKASLVPQSVLVDYFHDVWRADLRPEIPRVRAPILVITTETTWPDPESWTSARKRLGYDSKGSAIGRRVWGSGHLVPIDQPDSLAAAISEFSATLRP